MTASTTKTALDSLWKRVVGAAVPISLGAALVALMAAWLLLPLKEWAEAFRIWIEGSGAWGLLLFAGVYIVSTVLLVPVSALSVVAGLAFGLAVGFPLVVVSATIGATLAFLVSRFLIHAHVERLGAKWPKFRAVNAAVSAAGWKIVGLLRLSPVLPFNLQNYFYGVTDVELAPYVLATFVGILPGTLLYVYLGAAGKAAVGAGLGALQWTFFGLGLLATLGVAVFVAKKAKQKLEEYGVDAGGSTEQQGSGS